MTRFGRFPLALLLAAALAAAANAGTVRLVPEAALAPLGLPAVLVGGPGSAPALLTSELSALRLKAESLAASPTPLAVAPLLLEKAASPVPAERAAALIVAGSLADPSKAGPGAAELAAAAKADPALAGWFDGAAPRLELDGLTYKRGSWRRDGGKLERLGQGEYGFVDVHPAVDGAVIKTVAHSAAVELMSPQSAEKTASGEKETADLLAAADAGPRHLGSAAIDGALVSVRERVYGETLESLFRGKRFREEERALVLELLGRMADAGLMTNDLRPANIMIGRTAMDPRRRAYVVDGGQRVPLAGGVAAMLRETIVLRGNFVRDVGWVEHASTLEIMMAEGLERSSRDTAWKKFAGFFKDLGRAMVP